MKRIILLALVVFGFTTIEAQKKERVKQVAAPKEDQSDQ